MSDAVVKFSIDRVQMVALGGLFTLALTWVTHNRLNDVERSTWKLASADRVSKLEEILWHPGVRQLLEEQMSQWANRTEKAVDEPVRIRQYPDRW